MLVSEFQVACASEQVHERAPATAFAEPAPHAIQAPLTKPVPTGQPVGGDKGASAIPRNSVPEPAVTSSVGVQVAVHEASADQSELDGERVVK